MAIRSRTHSGRIGLAALLFVTGWVPLEAQGAQSCSSSLLELYTADALTVTFPEPLDHALLLRLLQVVTPARLPVEGEVEVDREETRWSFTPAQPWQSGRYYLEVGTVLEDLAGNTLDRPFEVDVFERIEERIIEEVRSLRFDLK